MKMEVKPQTSWCIMHVSSTAYDLEFWSLPLEQ